MNGGEETAGGAPILIACAVVEEIGPLLSRSRARSRRGRSPDSYEAELGGRRVVLATTGDGRRRAGISMRTLFERHRPVAWIGAGFAGAATPGIPAGTVLVGEDAGDPEWAGRVLAAGGALAARFVTVDRIAATPEEKSRIAQGAPAGVRVAIDMETSGWIDGAKGYAPGLVVRVVSDAAEEEIPAFVAAASSAEGVDRRRIVRHALTHPASIGKLLEMRRRARFCAERLADFLEALARRGFARP